jgi:hypothetical protein
MEDARWNLTRVEALANQFEALGTIAHVKVQEPSFAGHQSGHVSVRCYPEKLVSGGLARTMVADGDLADSDDTVHQSEVASNATSQCSRRQMVAPGHAPG